MSSKTTVKTKEEPVLFSTDSVDTKLVDAANLVALYNFAQAASSSNTMDRKLQSQLIKNRVKLENLLADKILKFLDENSTQS